MKAFISYSHADEAMLIKLKTHLAHLERERLLTSWTDQEISAGGRLNENISENLRDADLFIALLSPDYIASNYCYEKEFLKAIEMVKNGELIIVPIVIEPCEWLSTPFKDFKALPKDGKAISEWQNFNTAFLNVIQELRKLISGDNYQATNTATPNNVALPSRNYRLKKDFDSIQKLQFKQDTFEEVKELMIGFFKEVDSLEDVKHMVTRNNGNDFEAYLVNRNKINTESKLKISISADSDSSSHFTLGKSDLKYTFEETQDYYKSFELSNDEYGMFWINRNNPFNNREVQHMDSKAIANRIWDELIEKVGLV